VHGESVHERLRENGKPDRRACRRCTGVAEAVPDDRGHFLAVFGAERRGVEVEQQAIDAHR
jgi:hypothetical protein